MSYSEWVKGRETGYIDRAKLLNEMEHECENCEFRDSDGYECEECDYEHAMLYVKAQKAIKIQPVDRWISVDEALPEKDGYYLVVTQGIHNPTIDIAGFWHYAEWVQKEIRENYWNKYDKVLYWQPLPDLP